MVRNILIFCFLGAMTLIAQTDHSEKSVDDLTADLHWLGHSSFKIAGTWVVYIDPYNIGKGEPADIILCTHGHRDHYSPDDIRKIRKLSTILILPEGVDSEFEEVVHMSAGDTVNAKGVTISAVPAYNMGKDFHPQNRGDLGYVVTLDGVTYYHAGDTDRIPEMKDIRADVALLPVGGTYTMDASQAARAAGDIQPRVAVPMHWGTIVGSRDDAELFKDKCGCPVQILKKEK